MVVCPSCGQENPEGFRLCGMCGAAPTPAVAPSREERKVVTILFTDLVGSTARAEGLDPEDVRATLSSYYAALRAELERHGGTVEKFIGDAVMAIFGAPVAHEDDPERAVRAALAIRERIAEGRPDLQVRIGITTGEALVSPAARGAAGGRRAGRACRFVPAPRPARRSCRSARAPPRGRGWRRATSSTPPPGCKRPRRSTASWSASAPTRPRAGRSSTGRPRRCTPRASRSRC